jgi:serine/threonine protein kinase
MAAGPDSHGGASQEPTRIEPPPPSESSRATELEGGGSAGLREGATTEAAPSFRQPLASPPPGEGKGARAGSPSRLPGLPEPGQRLDDFDLLQILGEGAFGRVYLARQVSLGRQVALKVLANSGNEARTMASLEHDHIIRVFAETVRDNLRLLCMQYVPGTNLEGLLRFLARLGPPPSLLGKGAGGLGEVPPLPQPLPDAGRGTRTNWDGRVFLKAIDELSTQPAALEPAFLRDREFLGSCDFIEVVCWVGSRLAEALNYAHGQGILHRDVKPANILFNRYGRPMLADFSLACASHPTGESQVFGGTLAYMSPQHLDAFISRDHSSRQAVDQRSDLYSLGVVLFEFLTGRLPFPRRSGQMGGSAVATLAAERRSQNPSPRLENPAVPDVLDRAIRRCLEPEPESRYQTAGELAQALEGCRQLRQVEKDLPAAGPVTRAALNRPFLVLILLALLPNILGSTVNISYNSLRIVNDLETPQQILFTWLLIGYNAVTYAACLAIACWLLAPIIRTWKELHGVPKQAPPPLPSPPEGEGKGGGAGLGPVTKMRRRALTLPLWAAGLSCLGWLPGGVFFPLALQIKGPITKEIFEHFLFSFSISGLIAVTYSGLAVQWVVLRALYPKLWVDGSSFRQAARAELTSLDGRLKALQILAGLIPLAGAIMILSVGPDNFSLWFRLLATALIGLGMAGFALGLLIGSRIQQTLSALVG